MGKRVMAGRGGGGRWVRFAEAAPQVPDTLARWPPGLMSRIIVAASPCSASDRRVWVLGGWTSALMEYLRALHGPEAQNTLGALNTNKTAFCFLYLVCNSRLGTGRVAGVVASPTLASTLLS